MSVQITMAAVARFVQTQKVPSIVHVIRISSHSAQMAAPVHVSQPPKLD